MKSGNHLFGNAVAGYGYVISLRKAGKAGKADARRCPAMPRGYLSWFITRLSLAYGVIVGTCGNIYSWGL